MIILMTPLIGITTGEIINKDEPWSPITYGQSHTYSDAIIRANGIPLLIPITDNTDVLEQLYQKLDGLLFAGGNDIDPNLYGEQPGSYTCHVSNKRDTQEMLLIRWALRDKKPILAICRGMHLLNVIKGGSLYQDIATQIPDATDHEHSSSEKDVQHIAHTLRINHNSKLARIIESHTIKTNTHHHQAIKDIADGIRACAWSEDGIIEAVEGIDSHYLFGFQCHPESLHLVEPKWDLVFSSICNNSRTGVA